MIRALLLSLSLLGLLSLLPLGQSTLAFAQLPLPGAPAPDQPEPPQPAPDPEAERARVESHIAQAQGELTQIRQAAGDAEAQHGSDESTDLDGREALLQARIQVGRRHLQVLAESQSIRDDKEGLQRALDTGTGLSEPPPYALGFVEEIARALRSEQAAIDSDEMRLAAFARGKTLSSDALAEAEKAFRKTLEGLESAADDQAQESARARHAQSQLALTTAGEGVAFVRDSERVLRERLSLRRLRLGLARNRLADALLGLRLTDAEVQARLDALAGELKSADKSLAQGESAEETLRQQVARLKERIAGQGEHGAAHPDLKAQMALRQTQLEAIRATLDDINLRIGYTQLAQGLWKDRLALHRQWDFAKARAQSNAIATLLGPIAQGLAALGVAQTEAEAEADAFQADSRLAAPGLAAPRAELAATIHERDAQLALTLRSARQLQAFLELWQREIEVRLGDLGAAQQAKGWGDVLKERLSAIWGFEIVSVEDRLLVDGEQIVEKRPVTVGKVVEALLILVLGLLAASGLAWLLTRVVRPFSARGWQRRLLIQKLVRVAVIALVVVLALVTVKIPLAVFAFVGGAIALGIGFGLKNLINNFISGFILLGEGTIRPGDRIEIEGSLGIVQRIGERSTRVRRLDGVDLLIPNSHFLESSVTNMTLSDQRLRIAIAVGVAYGSPTREVQALLLEIARSHTLVVADPAPVAVFEDFGDSALIFRLYIWIDLSAQEDYRAVVTEVRHSIAERFAERGLQIPYPQRDLHLALASPIPVQVSRPDGRAAPRSALAPDAPV
jgi:potassium-dependent mechanosensitive channel